jgi:ketosteroid isomerase-like protein
MSANLDLVRSIYADCERGDYSQSEWADSEIEFVYADGPSPDRWIGLAGMAEGVRDWLSAWDEFRFVVDEFRELDDDLVLVFVRSSGRGKKSGVDLGDFAARGVQLFHVRNGKVTKLVRYLDRDRALADLGLEG